MLSLDFQTAVAVPNSLHSLGYEPALISVESRSVFDDFEFSLASLPSPEDIDQFEEVECLPEILGKRIAADIDDVADIFDGLANAECAPESLLEEHSEAEDVANIDDVAQIFDDYAVEALDVLSTEELNSCGSCDEDISRASPFTYEQTAVMKELGLSVAAMKRVLEVAQPFRAAPPRTTAINDSLIPRRAFLGLDARIPCISVPRIDNHHPHIRAVPLMVSSPLPQLQPTVISTERTSELLPVHDPKTCDICNSGKSDARKRVLHRFREKRQKRNWKRGPRYSARSNVASSRVRANGRFVSTCKWD